MPRTTQTHMTEGTVLHCRPCNMRLTVVSGDLEACPDCGRKLEYGGKAKVVEVVSQ